MKKMILILICSFVLFSCGKNQQELRTELTNKGYQWKFSGFLERIAANDKEGVRLYLDAGWRASDYYDDVINTYAHVEKPDPVIFEMLVNNLDNKYSFLEYAILLCVEHDLYNHFSIVLKSINDNLPKEGKTKLLNEVLGKVKAKSEWLSPDFEEKVGFDTFIKEPLEEAIKKL